MKHILLLILNCTFLIFNSSAQAPPEVTTLTAEVQYATDTAGLDADAIAMLPRRAVIDATMSSTQNVTGISVSVGSGEGSNDVFFKVYNLSGNNGSSGTLTQSGNTIHIVTALFQPTAQSFVSLALVLAGQMESENEVVEIVE